MTLAKTSGEKFVGGYAAMPWSSNKGHVDDVSESSFVFSVLLNEKYPISDRKHSILCNPDFGPTFGRGYDILIHDRCN